ncbi:hypothetical protein ARMGADRAFT_492346 [Armillaria gallica]|uniref:Uncharacterized protein n=1 Tax=Armillaria gallica TaxID=47427 RepID=A0A2H3DVC6_ARMGA|nr:hypothetical protein ARMGADRAFT_492346 [Armillaria gallica]
MTPWQCFGLCRLPPPPQYCAVLIFPGHTTTGPSQHEAHSNILDSPMISRSSLSRCLFSALRSCSTWKMQHSGSDSKKSQITLRLRQCCLENAVKSKSLHSAPGQISGFRQFCSFSRKFPRVLCFWCPSASCILFSMLDDVSSAESKPSFTFGVASLCCLLRF